MAPRSGDEEIGMYGFVQQGVDGVGPGAVLQEGRAQLQANPGEFPGCRILGELTDAGASDACQDGGQKTLNIAGLADVCKLQEAML